MIFISGLPMWDVTRSCDGMEHVCRQARCLISVFCLLVTIPAVSLGETTATLRLRFEIEGDARPPGNIVPTVDKQYCGANSIPDQRLIIHPKNRGLKNVIVYVYTGRRGTVLPASPSPSPSPSQTHRLAAKDCRFVPHVLLAKAGDTLIAETKSVVGHNPNFLFFNNHMPSYTRPIGEPVQIQLTRPEPGVVPVQCNIHPWMSAYLLVLDHRYAAVSDENGTLEISHLPAQQRIVFRVFHETVDFGQVFLDGTETHWKANRFERRLKPGINQMGTVTLAMPDIASLEH